MKARPSAQLVVKLSTLTSARAALHWRTQLSRIFSLLVCCRLDMMSFMMSFTCEHTHTHTHKHTHGQINRGKIKGREGNTHTQNKKYTHTKRKPDV